jgi:putative transposase
MLRTFQFRLQPNATQAAMLNCILADNCETYNAALQERKEAWKLERKSISLYDQQKELTELRGDPAFNWIAADIQRDPLRRVDRAFKAFFRRCKAGDTPGFPRYRSRYRYDSLSFNLPVVRAQSITVPKVGNIRMRGGRPVTGTPKQCTVHGNENRWTVSVVCEIGTAPEKCAVANPVGIDVGLTTLATLSDGTAIANPRWTRQHEAQIARLSRSLARKQKRSNNRSRARQELRRAHQRAANVRLNYIHHASKWLVQNYDLIAYEDLKIKNMVKSNLAKSIMDAAWGLLIWCIVYKAESAGKWAVPVNPRGTSQMCSSCGTVVKKKLSERVHSCACGLTLGRDHNAGLNILALGMSAVGISAERAVVA